MCKILLLVLATVVIVAGEGFDDIPSDTQISISRTKLTGAIRALSSETNSHDSTTEANSTASNCSHSGSAHDAHEHHVHPNVVILPLFIIVMLGCIAQYALSRLLPQVPYTLVLLLVGIALGMSANASRQAGNTGPWLDGLDMLIDIDSHLLLTLFLPALLFGDAICINVFHFYGAFSQCLTLASGGVLLGTALTALVGKYVLPYDWPWSICALFGSIMAATDPVAVVALLKDVGASPILTMQIMGESLLNDGAAIVLFTLFLQAATSDKEFTAWGIIGFFLQMAINGPLIGLWMGWVLGKCLRLLNRPTNHSDSLVQVTWSLAGAYCVFYFAEFVAASSGVLATVFAGITMAQMIWPAVLNREGFHEVWHSIEYLANTVLFTLAGLIWGHETLAAIWEGQLTGADFGYLILNFILMVVIRFVMIGVHFPILKRVGYGCSIQEAIFMAWGGLRGAVGLAMAIAYTQHTEKSSDPAEVRNGQLIMFYVGGGAVCTMLFLAPTSAMMLKYLGLTKTSEAQKVLLDGVDKRSKKHLIEFYEKNVSSDPRFKLHDAQTVKHLTGLDKEISKIACSDKIDMTSECNSEFLITVRTVFLAVVRSRYWGAIEKGILPGDSRAARLCLASIDIALDEVSKGLQDYEYLLAKLKKNMTKEILIEKCIDPCLPSCLKFDNYILQKAYVYKLMRQVYALTSFIEAHKVAQHVIAVYFGVDEDIDTPEEAKVIQESKELVKLAEAELEALRNDEDGALKHAVTIQVSNMLIDEQRKYILRVTDNGVISPAEAHNKLHHLEAGFLAAKALKIRKVCELAERRMDEGERLVALAKDEEKEGTLGEHTTEATDKGSKSIAIGGVVYQAAKEGDSETVDI